MSAWRLPLRGGVSERWHAGQDSSHAPSSQVHGDITAMQERHGRVLWVVLRINAVMVRVEGGAGVMAPAASLLADALEMLGDTLMYGLSLVVLARSARWQAGAALAKGPVSMPYLPFKTPFPSPLALTGFLAPPHPHVHPQSPRAMRLTSLRSGG